MYRQQERKELATNLQKKAHRVFSRESLSNLTPVKFQLGTNIATAVD